MSTEQPSSQFLPTSLPVPIDDGACAHLPNKPFPSLTLPSTAGTPIDPSNLSGLTIIFCYPRTASPGEVVPDEWNAIPGARGCTPQACAFRDAYDELAKLGVNRVFGASTQSTEYQQELKERTHLPYEILSDEGLGMVEKLGLPTFEFGGRMLIKRLTLAVRDGVIERVWYPVFPSDKSAEAVVEWLKSEKK